MLLKLFTTFIKIGTFTFGGGYAMISIVKDECVEKNKWIENDEFMNLIAVAESTPGPIAINMATYVGYKVAKMPGAIISTIGMVLPSIIIIYFISIFFKDWLDIKIVSDAFFGIRIAVAIAIIFTAYNLLKDEYKSSKRKKLTISLFCIYMIVMLLINIFKINISSVIIILSSIILGIIFA